jgi:hypothetical protein
VAKHNAWLDDGVAALHLPRDPRPSAVSCTALGSLVGQVSGWVMMWSARYLASCHTPQMKLDPRRESHGSLRK